MSEAFFIFGHRGSPRRFPENTLASFDEALRAGADGFETDLRILADQTAVLFHDDELGGTEIETLAAADFPGQGAAVQRLEDLASYAGRTTMVLEIKRAKWEDALLEHVSAWPNIILASFDHSTIRDLHARGTEIPLGLTWHGQIVDAGAYAARLGATWCFPNYRFVDAETVSSLHAHGVKVVPWTPNRVREWEQLREAGCDGIITDLPAEAVAWRAGSGRTSAGKPQFG